MTIQNRTCSICGRNNVHDALYCRKGCGSLPTRPQQTNTYVTRSNQQHIALNQYRPSPANGLANPLHNVAHDLDAMRSQLLRAKNELKQGGLLWRIFGKGAYRRELGKKFDAMFAQIEATIQVTYLGYQEQQAAYLLRQQQQQYDFEHRYREFLFE